MGLTRSEQETVLRWDDEEQIVRIWSSSPKTWRKVEKLGIRPHRGTPIYGKPAGKFYHLPLDQFRWRLKGRRRAPGNADALRRARDAKRQGA